MVMRIAFILVTLYTGPFGLLIYVLADKEPRPEWLKREWLTYPAMLMDGGLPNYFSINGKAYP
jgi:hypothetical protein